MAITNELFQLGMCNLVWKRHKHSYELCMKYCLYVNNYKYGSM